MLETLSHLFGVCGEPHPSIMWLLTSSGVVFYTLKHRVKWCWKAGCHYCKSKLLKNKKVKT